MDKSIRTDLALEANQWREQQGMAPNDGIISRHDVKEHGITIDTVDVKSENASRELGKGIGRYITITSDKIPQRDPTVMEQISVYMSKAMQDMLPRESRDKGILIVGLGNRYVTADSVGPRVVENTMVTRHMLQFIPDQVDKRIKPVSAVSPGVLGITGIETEEIVSSLVSTVKPGAVIAVDALAARSVTRINTTVQISDTGISPGAGVGNKRKGLSRDSLGIPVIAVGTPTVVYASTIINEVADSADKDRVNAMVGDMVVTPREIDTMVDDMAKVISMGLNLLIHEGLTIGEVRTFLN